MPAEWEARDCCWMAWPCRPLPTWDLDDARRATVSIAAAVARRVCTLTGARHLVAGLTLEGGALHVDGEGTVLTTEEVVLDPCRNPGLERAEAERLLCDCLGARKVIWLTGRLDADNTGGHVDNLACFAGRATVPALAEEDPADSQYGCLQENLERLRAARDARGRRLRVVPVRQPLRRVHAGRALSPSYINFCTANGGIVMPVFGDAMDEPAVATSGAVFPFRQVLTVDGRPPARSDGGVHCVTQQQPRLCVAGSCLT
ncbi:MAG: agmatine deiminase family protein [Actinobacteria bacterium]|nr:agmatine deiminase family protein [Actinomycetota bacterium]